MKGAFVQLGVLQTVLSDWRQMNAAMRENLTMYGAIVLLALAALIWAAYFRKRRKHHHHHHHHHHHGHEWGKNPGNENGNESPMLLSLFKTRKKRKLRKAHRPRNPTLAETGGMPSIREDRPSSSET
jgi:hypothetical protein